MADFGFVGPSYVAPSIYQNGEECINFFPEIDATKQQSERGVVALYPTPGLDQILQLNNAQVRGMRALSGGQWLIAVVGASVYAIQYVSGSYTNTIIGTLTTTTGTVSITDNQMTYGGLTAYIVDGVNRYTWIAGTATTFNVMGSQSASVNSITLNAGGTSYSNPVVTIGGTSTLAATATAVWSNSITGATIVSGGTGYVNPKATFSAPQIAGGVTATATLTVTSNVITAITITNAGSGYTSLPTIAITDNTTTSVTSGTIGTAGTGYIAGDVVTITGGAGTSASFNVLAVGGLGQVTSISLASGGTYTSNPSNPCGTVGGTGTGLTINVTLTGGGSGANITSTGNPGVITAINMYNIGTGYTSVPSVTITDSTGSGANATAVLGTQVLTVTATSGALGAGRVLSNGAVITAQVSAINGGLGTYNLSSYTLGGSVTYTTPTWFQLPATDGPWQGASVCDVMDNYIIYNQVGTQNWAVTDIGSPFSANAYYGTKDGSPDNLVTLIVDRRQVYLLGEKTIEVWVDVGNQINGVISFPFARVAGTSSQFGIAAPASVARFSDQIMFVSQNTRGQAEIGAMQGYSFVRLSNHAVEQTLMNQYIADAVAYSYQLEGHEMYVVTFPSINLTWVFDLSTKMWHKWLSWDSINKYSRHLSNCGAFFNNVYLVGDYQNGIIYQLNNQTYTDNGTTIRRLRRTTHLITDLQRQYFSELQIQFQPGVGLETGQGQNPQAMLRWSNDGGSTWSNEYWSSIGAVGTYKTRIIWRRLGYARDRVWEVVVTDPIKAVIVSANLKGEGAEN